MRENIPNCIVDIDRSNLSYEFLWSLRYSTHCNYYINDEIFCYSNYIYINSFDINKNISNDFKINIFQNELKISNDGIKVDEIINNVVLYKDMDYDSLSLYMLVDFDGDYNVLGALKYLDGNVKCIDHQKESFSDVVELIKNRKAKSLINKLIHVEIKDDIIFNTIINAQELKKLRSCGINIPLVIIQNFYKRKVKTFKFIDSIEKDKIYVYDLSSISTVYFDLDETLIWEGKPIKESIDLLYNFLSSGKKIRLLTRHKKNIIETLTLIGIDYKIFDKIIKVADGEKKSSFIDENSLFIDNEFPERYDVMCNSNIPVLDLDQLEFIK